MHRVLQININETVYARGWNWREGTERRVSVSRKTDLPRQNLRAGNLEGENSIARVVYTREAQDK